MINRNRAYGISTAYICGCATRYVCGPFESEEQAQEWLETEEYEFRRRELVSKTTALRLCSKKAVDNAPERLAAWLAQRNGAF